MGHRVGCFVLLVLLVLTLGAGQASALSHQASTSYATGPNPAGLAVGDLNGDGRLDLVTSNVTADSVSVLLGAGGGVFSAARVFATGDDPYAVAMGDVNGDGNADVVTADRAAGKVSVLLGNGQGAVGAKTDYSVGVSPMGVRITDLNRDGRPDIVTNNNGCNSVGVLLGAGGGAFAPVVRTSTALSPWSMDIGDVTRDGRTDVVTANMTASSVSIFPGAGDGGFGARQDLAAATPTCVAIGDVDGDGVLDIVSGDMNSTASVWLGTGAGGFAARQSFPTGVQRPISIKPADLNGDGVDDLVLATGDAASSSAKAFLALGDGSLGPAIEIPTGAGPTGIEAVDLNDDAKLDLVTANNTAQTVSVMLGEFEAPSGTMMLEAGSAATGPRVVRVCSRVAEATQMRTRDQDGEWSDWVTSAPTSYWSLPGADGAKTVETQYRNSVGTTGVLSDSILLDTTAPATTSNEPAGWQTSLPQTVSLTPDDGSGSGVATTQYKLDAASAWSEGTSVEIDADGAHMLRYRSVDEVGNVEETRFTTVRLDATPPAVSVGGVDDAWHTGPVLAMFAATDQASGVADVSYQLDAGAWTSAWGVLVATDGIHTLAYRATDVAGNASAEQTVQVRGDTTGPATSGLAASARAGKKASFKVLVSDALSTGAPTRATVVIKSRAGKTLKTLPAASVTIGTQATVSWTRCTLKRGTYKYAVLAADAAGNVQSKAGGNKLVVR
jgi:hypothetical protein